MLQLLLSPLIPIPHSLVHILLPFHPFFPSPTLLVVLGALGKMVSHSMSFSSPQLFSQIPCLIWYFLFFHIFNQCLHHRWMPWCSGYYTVSPGMIVLLNCYQFSWLMGTWRDTVGPSFYCGKPCICNNRIQIAPKFKLSGFISLTASNPYTVWYMV